MDVTIIFYLIPIKDFLDFLDFHIFLIFHIYFVHSFARIKKSDKMSHVPRVLLRSLECLQVCSVTIN